MKYLCNPVNINYRYQFNRDNQNPGNIQVAREAADPSMICFKGRYYIFASMTLGVWVSDDLAVWENKRLPENLPLYDYAPDVRVIGEYVYFSASKRGEICNYYRTKDILNGSYEEIAGTFDFWDPNLFCDDDGRIFFYWGCTNSEPIWGVELPGAGHGSAMKDMEGHLWHTATMRISVNHIFERRVGIWPAGFDADGELFCNQRYGDWPLELENMKKDPWAEPEWYLLSYRKPVTASSFDSVG